ncbi:MAG: T9SS type A sorting domain-containing protein, partial [Draconibacterium sp.]|nr:T9SS type A sorting domain-containing protein [Draconibacterium sp.]
SHAWIGWNKDATVEINGGIVNVGGMYGTAFDGQSGKGTVLLKSGEFNLTGFHPEKSIPEGSVLDIEEGIVSIPGDHREVARAYIDLGRITAYGGNEEVYVHFRNDTTYLDTEAVWTSVDIVEEQFSVRVYPNPTDGKLTIENPEGNEFSFSVYNIIGKLVQQKVGIRSNKAVADLTGMPQGIYIINVRSEGRQTTQKIILR